MKRLLDFLGGLPLHWQPPYRPQDPLVSLPFTAQLYTHVHTHMRAYTHGNTHTCTQMPTNAQAPRHEAALIHLHTQAHADIWTCMWTHMRVSAHTRAHRHARATLGPGPLKHRLSWMSPVSPLHQHPGSQFLSILLSPRINS